MGSGGGTGQGGDPLRLLSARSEYGYTDRIDQALRDEPEAVSAREQKALTELAHRRAGELRLEAFAAMSASVNLAVDQFASVVHDPGLGSGIRQIRRSVQAVGRRLAQ